MIESVIDEILAAEAEARRVVAEATDSAGKIAASAAEKTDALAKECAARRKKNADKLRAAAEKTGEAEAKKLLSEAEAAAADLRAQTKLHMGEAVDLILSAAEEV